MKTIITSAETTSKSAYRRTAKSAKKLTKAQEISRARVFKYLSLWDEIYEKWGWAKKSKAEKDELRHGINEDLFGSYIAPSKLSNEQFSIMRYALEILLNEGILIWSKEIADIAMEEGSRRIYTWWIEHAGLDIEGIAEYGAPEYYIAAIARDRFHGVADWRTLSADKLWQLFITIKNRVRKASEQGRSLYQPKASEQNDDKFPF